MEKGLEKGSYTAHFSCRTDEIIQKLSKGLYASLDGLQKTVRFAPRLASRPYLQPLQYTRTNVHPFPPINCIDRIQWKRGSKKRAALFIFRAKRTKLFRTTFSHRARYCQSRFGPPQGDFGQSPMTGTKPPGLGLEVNSTILLGNRHSGSAQQRLPPWPPLWRDLVEINDPLENSNQQIQIDSPGS